jgi:hypothetical protein
MAIRPPVPSRHGPGDERTPGAHAGGVHRRPGLEVIGPIEDDVVSRDQAQGCARVEPDGVRLHDHARVPRADPIRGRFDLEASEVFSSELKLAVKVRQLHPVEIRQPQDAHAGSGQGKGGRAA